MDCERFRNDWLDDPGAQADHAASCPACAAFVARQQALDERLARALTPPQLSPSFRPALRARMRRERPRAWREKTPDLVYLGSCAVATAACAVWAPLAMTTVLGAGAAIALGGYVVVTTLLDSLNALELPDS